MSECSNNKMSAVAAVLSVKEKIENEWSELTYDDIRKKIYEEIGCELHTCTISNIISKHKIKRASNIRQISLKKSNNAYFLNNPASREGGLSWR